MAMPEVILSDYFYGDESEEFIYFKIPRLLITDQKFKHVSTDAKLLYGMLLDRMGLSAKNDWYDDSGRVYIYYTVDEICEDMCCGRGRRGLRLQHRLGIRGFEPCHRKYVLLQTQGLQAGHPSGGDGGRLYGAMALKGRRRNHGASLQAHLRQLHPKQAGRGGHPLQPGLRLV